LLAAGAFAADKATIKIHVDAVVTAINNGQPTTGYSADTYAPYVFIMDADGKLIVHPHLAGEYLQEKAAPIYKALRQATTDGTWVTYIWKGAPKETYVRRTNDNLTVGSGN
jgi:signal transduction histidine kinase